MGPTERTVSSSTRVVPVIAPAVLAIATGTALFETLGYPAGSKVYPSAVLGTLLILTVVIATQNMRNATKASDEDDKFKKRQVVRTAFFAGVWVIFPVAMVQFGFLLPTVVALSASFVLLEMKHIAIWCIGSIPAALTLLVIMQLIFNIAVPQAPMDRFITGIFYAL